MTTPLQWASTEGGPLILIAAPHLSDWEGTAVPSGGRVVQAAFRYGGHPDAPATDYDRACDVTGPLGVIAVGPGLGLVLGDEPNNTTWLPTGQTAGTLARWVYGEDDGDENVVAIIASAPDEAFTEEPFTFTVMKGPLYLFDSAYRGSDAAGGQVFGGVIVIDLAPGVYRVESAQHRPDAETWLDLYRFSLMEDQA